MTKQSIPEYISELGIHQLETLISMARDKVKKFEEEEKFTVWRVSDGRFVSGNFRQEDFLSAVEHLISEIKEHAEKHPNTDIYLILEGQKEHKSEYEEYFR